MNAEDRTRFEQIKLTPDFGYLAQDNLDPNKAFHQANCIRNELIAMLEVEVAEVTRLIAANEAWHLRRAPKEVDTAGERTLLIAQLRAWPSWEWPGPPEPIANLMHQAADALEAEAAEIRRLMEERAEILNTELKGAWAGQAMLQARIEALEGCLRDMANALMRYSAGGIAEIADLLDRYRVLLPPTTDPRSGPDGPVADHVGEVPK